MYSNLPPPTVWDRIGIIYGATRALCAAVYAFILSPFRGEAGAPSVKYHVRLAAIRSLLTHTSVQQIQHLSRPIQDIHKEIANKKGFPLDSISLSDDTRAYWLCKNKDAEKILVWFHGGGYCFSADIGHLKFTASIAGKAGTEMAVLLPTYDLAPQVSYPRQLTQGVEIVRYLITELGRKPENIILAGDSAGGNLVIGILSHISHPHPQIPPLHISAPFRGILLLTPWVSFGPMFSSGQRCKDRDIISPEIASKWSRAFLGAKKRDEYNEPLTADAAWWQGLKAEEILLVASADECLTDDVTRMGKILKSVHPNTNTILVEGEFHDQPIFGKESDQGIVITSWILSRMGSHPLVDHSEVKGLNVRGTKV